MVLEWVTNTSSMLQLFHKEIVIFKSPGLGDTWHVSVSQSCHILIHWEDTDLRQVKQHGYSDKYCITIKACILIGIYVNEYEDSEIIIRCNYKTPAFEYKGVMNVFWDWNMFVIKTPVLK